MVGKGDGMIKWLGCTKIFVAATTFSVNINSNSTPHASRQICAPRGVKFFAGAC